MCVSRSVPSNQKLKDCTPFCTHIRFYYHSHNHNMMTIQLHSFEDPAARFQTNGRILKWMGTMLTKGFWRAFLQNTKQKTDRSHWIKQTNTWSSLLFKHKMLHSLIPIYSNLGGMIALWVGFQCDVFTPKLFSNNRVKLVKQWESHCYSCANNGT
jgi:hypothetical protein